MAVYCTYNDLVTRFGSTELGQLTNNVGDCPAVSLAIADASSLIDSYLAHRYVLPLNPPIPVVVTKCACDLVRYALWDLQAVGTIGAHVRVRYEDTIALLRSIADGHVMLEVVLPAEPTLALVKFSQEQRNVWKRDLRGGKGNESSGFW